MTKEKIGFLREYLFLLATRNFAAFSFVLCALIGMILLGSQILLLNAFNDAIAETTLVTREYGGVNFLIKNANLKLSTLNAIEREYTPWSSTVVSVAKLTPANISFVSFSANKNTREILLRGVAGTRVDLLKFMKNLEDSKLFEIVESPLSNLLTKEDLAFDLKMKLYEIKTISKN